MTGILELAKYWLSCDPANCLVHNLLRTNAGEHVAFKFPIQIFRTIKISEQVAYMRDLQILFLKS